MPPTRSTVVAASSAEPPTHQASIPAMVALALFLSMMAALAIGVILRQRSAMAALKCREKVKQDKQRSARAGWSWFSPFKPRLTGANADNPTAVGALHATSVLLAAAPCQVFSHPMTMHFRIPLEDKTILILGVPWFPVRCGAQYCGAPAVRSSPLSGSATVQKHVDDNNSYDHTLPDLLKVPPSTISLSCPTATDHYSFQAVHRASTSPISSNTKEIAQPLRAIGRTDAYKIPTTV
ncbi:hypothetical protein J3R82DRAFT_3780 [Butyriboletus roseoflavus]|nr:hypothetical protein J3R82DRAFT_3780 [Butyriboletus roseoflavus]